jgi:phospholipase C
LLGSDEAYLEAGRRRYGSGFRVNGRVDASYRPADSDAPVTTQRLVGAASESNPWRGCDHSVPGHTWREGRRQLESGFLAAGTGNDDYAIGYFQGVDLPYYSEVTARFTVLDNYFPSLLASTFPNRQYLHSAQSNGNKNDPPTLDVGIFSGRTIWDLLERARVPARYYYTDLPVLLLWGEQYTDRISSTDRFFEDCDQGRLPRVAFIDPGFGGDLRTDDHPQGDVRLGQRFLREIFGAFRRSPHWERGAFILTYDEWGGFFDHVRPPRLADARASKRLDDDFGQTGFRVPAVLGSPYGLRGGVDHRVYDHTSILRFIEWRFLGAPAEGANGGSGRWWLTTRDRHANNLGASLRPDHPDTEEWVSTLPVAAYSPACASAPPLAEDAPSSDPFTYSAKFTAVLAEGFPGPTLTPWITNERETPLPSKPTNPPETAKTPTSSAPTTSS